MNISTEEFDATMYIAENFKGSHVLQETDKETKPKLFENITKERIDKFTKSLDPPSLVKLNSYARELVASFIGLKKHDKAGDLEAGNRELEKQRNLEEETLKILDSIDDEGVKKSVAVSLKITAIAYSCSFHVDEKTREEIRNWFHPIMMTIGVTRVVICGGGVLTGSLIASISLVGIAAVVFAVHFMEDDNMKSVAFIL